jgi:hypothetical protein
MNKTRLVSVPVAFSLWFFAALSARTAVAQTACPDRETPPADGALLFTEDQFGGTCTQITLFRFPHSGFRQLGDFGLDGQIHSVKVGSEVRLVMFNEPRFGSRMDTAEGEVLYVRKHPASSLRLESLAINPDCRNIEEGMVAFFEHEFFQGDCFVWQGAPFYLILDEHGFRNDLLSSAINLTDHQVIFWENAHRGGGGNDWVAPFHQKRWMERGMNDLTTLVTAGF